MSPCATMKLVSVAPRSRRLNSASLPRLRSHPIQRRSLGVPPALAVEEEETVRRRGARSSSSTRRPCMNEQPLVSFAGRFRAVGESRESSAKWRCWIAVGEEPDLEIVEERHRRAGWNRRSPGRRRPCDPPPGCRSAWRASAAAAAESRRHEQIEQADGQLADRQQHDQAPTIHSSRRRGAMPVRIERAGS